MGWGGGNTIYSYSGEEEVSNGYRDGWTAVAAAQHNALDTTELCIKTGEGAKFYVHFKTISK